MQNQFVNFFHFCLFFIFSCVRLEMPSIKKAMTAAVAGLFAAGAMNAPANALTKDQVTSLSYLQVKGSGLANRCPEIPGSGSQTIAINGKYKLNQMCSWQNRWAI